MIGVHAQVYKAPVPMAISHIIMIVLNEALKPTTESSMSVRRNKAQAHIFAWRITPNVLHVPIPHASRYFTGRKLAMSNTEAGIRESAIFFSHHRSY